MWCFGHGEAWFRHFACFCFCGFGFGLQVNWSPKDNCKTSHIYRKITWNTDTALVALRLLRGHPETTEWSTRREREKKYLPRNLIQYNIENDIYVYIACRSVLLSRVSILLLTRDIDIVILSVRLSVRPSVCLSVRLSVTRWYCMKTA